METCGITSSELSVDGCGGVNPEFSLALRATIFTQSAVYTTVAAAEVFLVGIVPTVQPQEEQNRGGCRQQHVVDRLHSGSIASQACPVTYIMEARPLPRSGPAAALPRFYFAKTLHSRYSVHPPMKEMP